MIKGSWGQSIPRFDVKRVTFVSAVILSAASCRGSTSVLELTTGESVSDHLSADSAIVAVFDPAACMSCDNMLYDWFLWAKTHPGRFALVLTREPSPEERARMVLRRIAPLGVVKRRVGQRSWSIRGADYALFVNGRLNRLEASSASTMPPSLQAATAKWLDTNLQVASRHEGRRADSR